MTYGTITKQTLVFQGQVIFHSKKGKEVVYYIEDAKDYEITNKDAISIVYAIDDVIFSKGSFESNHLPKG